MTFSVARRAVSYSRTLDHLRAWQLRLPDGVREMVVSIGSDGGREHEGTQLFLQQNVPQLKYHNPSVQFSINTHHTTKSELLLVSEDGRQQSVETTGLRWQDIKQKLNTLSHNP